MASAATAVARTPDSRFEGLDGFDFTPHYVEVPATAAAGGTLLLRVHYLDEGPRDAPHTVLLLHGQPTWCYLYRKMIPLLVAAGHRVLCPDLVGYGRSDKPVGTAAYSYRLQVQWMSAWLEAVSSGGCSNMTFFGQDWGGLIGLRLVAAFPERFDRVCVSNTALPAGEMVPSWLVAPLRRSYELLPSPSMTDVVAAFQDRTRQRPSAWAVFKMAVLRMVPSPDSTLAFLVWGASSVPPLPPKCAPFVNSCDRRLKPHAVRGAPPGLAPQSSTRGRLPTSHQWRP
jgi:pimeloyl-ACP methyl ester carboxylesterase